MSRVKDCFANEWLLCHHTNIQQKANTKYSILESFKLKPMSLIEDASICIKRCMLIVVAIALIDHQLIYF